MAIFSLLLPLAKYFSCLICRNPFYFSPLLKSGGLDKNREREEQERGCDPQTRETQKRPTESPISSPPVILNPPCFLSSLSSRSPVLSETVFFGLAPPSQVRPSRSKPASAASAAPNGRKRQKTGVILKNPPASAATAIAPNWSSSSSASCLFIKVA